MGRTAVVVDDHPICRAATVLALQAIDPTIRVIEAATVAEAQAAAPDAAVMTLDIGLPDTNGTAGLSELRREFPSLPILVVSGSANPAIARQVARLGAQGFLSKAAPIAEIVEALRAVLSGESWFAANDDTADDCDDYARLATLTPAQTRVLQAMEGGRLNKQIAYDLGLSEITVKAHVKAILRKLGAVNRTQAVLMLGRAAA